MMSNMMMKPKMMGEEKKDQIDEEVLMQIMEFADQLLREKGGEMKSGDEDASLSIEMEGMMLPKDAVAEGEMAADEDEEETAY